MHIAHHSILDTRDDRPTYVLFSLGIDLARVAAQRAACKGRLPCISSWAAEMGTAWSIESVEKARSRRVAHEEQVYWGADCDY